MVKETGEVGVVRQSEAWNRKKGNGRGEKHLSPKEAGKSTVAMFPPQDTKEH